MDDDDVVRREDIIINLSITAESIAAKNHRSTQMLLNTDLDLIVYKLGITNHVNVTQRESPSREDAGDSEVESETR